MVVAAGPVVAAVVVVVLVVVLVPIADVLSPKSLIGSTSD